MADLTTGNVFYREPQIGSIGHQANVSAGMEAKHRDVQTEQALEAARTQQPTPEEAAAQMQFYHKALGDVASLKEKKYTMPAQKPTEGGAAGQAAGTTAAGPISDQERQLNADAQRVVKFNLGRLNEMERSGQLPAPLPFDQAQENFMTVVGYLNKSSEAKSNPAVQAAMKENIAKAQAKVDELVSQARESGTPMDRGAIREAFVRELAQCVGQDDRIPPAFSLSGIDYTRAQNNSMNQ